MRAVIIGFLLLFGSQCHLACQPYFDYHDGVAQAYHQILQLRTDTARKHIDSLKVLEPDNLALLHIENYIDFFTVFLGEQEFDLQVFKENKDRRLETIRDQDIDSPYWRFAQAEIMLQYALARSKFGQYVRAGWDINRANKLLARNLREYPNFQLSYKSLSVIHALVGSIKGFKRSIISLFTSLKGSYEQGVSEISLLYNAEHDQKSIFDKEIQVLRALISYHIEEDQEAARSFITDLGLEQTQSPLIDFVRYTITHSISDIEEDPLEILLTAQGRPYDTPFLYLDLLIGINLLQRGDKSANDYLIKYIRQFNGRHYVKEAYQKMAWYELIINDDESAYINWMEELTHVGNNEIGEDQQAHAEAEEKIVPNKHLLKARLFLDGGFYQEGLSALQEIDSKTLKKEEELEYLYRKSRLLQKLNKDMEALEMYKKVLALGSTSKKYYACNAALQSGIIYYNLDMLRQAKSMWMLCLEISPEEHQESLHQKANNWLLKTKGL